MLRKTLATAVALLLVVAIGVGAAAWAAPASRPVPDQHNNLTKRVDFHVWPDVWFRANSRWRVDLVWHVNRTRDPVTGVPLPEPLPRVDFGYGLIKGWVRNSNVVFETDPWIWRNKAYVPGGGPNEFAQWNYVVTVESFGLPRQYIFNPELDEFFGHNVATKIAMDDVFTIKKNSGPVTLNVLDNDFYDAIPPTNIVVDNHDPQYQVNKLGSQQVLLARGTAIGSRDSITYTPPPNFTGVDTFDYFLGDWTFARVRVNVVP
jgi:hypothetical protein